MVGATGQSKHPIVLRFEGLFPDQLGGYEAHRLRKGGDLGHVDPRRSGLNTPLIGAADWVATALAEIADMTAENFASELESLQARNRKADIRRRMVEGPKMPWRPTRHGPMREVILTANSAWFADGDGFFDDADSNLHEELFQQRAVAWLKDRFGDDVIHARADRDERAYHIHAVILPRATILMEKPKARTPVSPATRRMLQPSIHPLIEDYEAAQDDVGAWFAEIGLTRGERRAEAIRQARANGQTPPARRPHAQTAQWRAEQDRALYADRTALDERAVAFDKRAVALAAREAEADAIIAVAEVIGSGESGLETTEGGAWILVPPARRPAAPGTPAARMALSPRGVARALAAFGGLWQRLAGMSKDAAEAAAAAKVAKAAAEIRAADDIIVDIATALPVPARQRIAKARNGLIARLQLLERRSGESEAGKGRSKGPGDENSR